MAEKGSIKTLMLEQKLCTKPKRTGLTENDVPDHAGPVGTDNQRTDTSRDLSGQPRGLSTFDLDRLTAQAQHLCTFDLNCPTGLQLHRIQGLDECPIFGNKRSIPHFWAGRKD